MIKSLDLREIDSSKKTSKTVLFCGTELDKKILDKKLCGVYKLNIEDYPNAKDYKEMSAEEIIDYVKGFYENVLSKLNPEKVATQLRYTMFTSDERTDSLAKRHIVAEWINLYTEEEVEEITINVYEDGSYEYVEVERPKFIKRVLEAVIKASKDMKGFDSLRALYLFEKAEMLDKVADRFRAKYGVESPEYCEHRQAACFLRCDADEIESEYQDEVMTNVRKKHGYGKRTIRISSK